VESESNPAADEGGDEVISANAVNDAGQSGTRRSGRKRSSRGQSVAAKKRSTGPLVDATRIDIESIRSVINSKQRGKSSSTFLSFLDFVNVSDQDIEYLFVSDYIRKQSKALIFPPRSHR